MRVVLIVGRFPAPSQTFVVSHFLGLLADGVDVHVVCSGSDAAAWQRHAPLVEARHRVHLHSPRERPLATARELLGVLPGLAVRPRRVARLLRAARGGPLGARIRRVLLGAQILGLRPDVIHFEFGTDAVGAMWLREAAGCAVVVSLRGYDVNYDGLDDPGRYDEIWAKADALHCLGEDLWQRAQRRGCPPDRLHHLIPPSVDVGFFGPGDAPRDERFIVLTVARLHWKKGYEDALLAVRSLVDQGIDIEYRIVGEGPHEEAVLACVRDLGLGPYVRLRGEGPGTHVLAELREADVLLHPAVSEGFGNAVLEAQAVEVPVVCTDADGLRENVVDGETGFVVPRRDPAALAAALARLAADPDLRRRLGAAGRRHVSSGFDPVAQIAAFRTLYAAAQRGAESTG